ncbi:MAG: M48 family metallopeptidase, partial [Bacteroidota bacterium]
MTHKLFLLVFFALIILQTSYAQLDNNYHPVQMQGEIPEDVLASVKEQTYKEMAEGNTSFSDKQNKQYFALSNYAFKQAMQSGKLYFNDRFSAYLEGIAARLLKDDPELKKSIRIYATKLPMPNASAWRNGVIFVNIPLLSYLESEAQLAFVLAHEISHYKRKHVYNQYKKKIDLERSVYNNSKTVDELFELMKFSRKNELQADADAFEMLLKTDYTPVEALGALVQLAEIDNSPVSFPYKINELFQFEDSLFDFKISCDSAYYSFKPKRTNQVDSLSTHPDIEERIEIITEKLQEVEEIGGELFLEGELVFRKIQEMAYVEQIQNFYDMGSYLVS